MTITTQQVWSALPYTARGTLAEEAQALYDDMEPGRVAVTPWNLLPEAVKEALHAQTTCTQRDGP